MAAPTGYSRWLTWLHRWLGIPLSLFFVMWFVTGAVMIFVPFPSLSGDARIGRAEQVPLVTLQITPKNVTAILDGLPLERLRLLGVLGQARYIADLADGRSVAISNEGRLEPLLNREQAAAIATRSTAPVRAIVGPMDHDQWIVHQRFDPARPFFRIELDDPEATALYVSARTGEVLQKTTAFERKWNWLGSIPHWIYPTVLRKHFRAWDQTVWWMALAGTSTALLGLVLGTMRTLDPKRPTRRGLSPFRGWFKWHHVLGLTAGLPLLTWILSGWLSMDHGRLFPLDGPVLGDVQRLRGVSIEKAVHDISLDQLRSLSNAREIEFIAVGGQGFVIVRNDAVTSPATTSMVVPAKRLTEVEARKAVLSDDLLLVAARNAWKKSGVEALDHIAPDDAYAHLRNEPLPVTTVRIRLADANATWVHLDAASGRIVSIMDRHRRLYRWLYHGLHTFDFPWLNHAGSLWRILMLIALMFGLVLSLTSVVLGIRHLRRGRQAPRRA